eukprot:6180648-Pleurochrysis_carterae.AAC.2
MRCTYGAVVYTRRTIRTGNTAKELTRYGSRARCAPERTHRGDAVLADVERELSDVGQQQRRAQRHVALEQRLPHAPRKAVRDSKRSLTAQPHAICCFR